MFTVPSRSRPSLAARLIAACQATGMTAPAMLIVDDDDPCLVEYRALALPGGWELVTGRRAPLATIYNEAYQAVPGRRWHGFLADDVVPATPGWDAALIETAGLDGMAVPAGGETTGGCPHFVLGGNLVRSMGWLALPGLDRLYIDTVWHDIAMARGVYRERPDILLDHRHFSNGKALLDATYKKHRKAEDKAIYQTWKQKEGYA